MKVTRNMKMLALLYFVSFIAFALPYGYMQMYLTSIGYTVLERGIILSGTAVVAIVGQFVIGYLCDKYQSDKKFYNITIILLIVFTLLMYQVTDKVFFMHLIFVSLVGGLLRITMAVQDAWCLETDDDCKDNYGPLRAFGAIGWMIGSPIGAIVIADYGYATLGFVFALLSIVNVIITHFMEDATKHEKSASITVKDLRVLFHSKKYVLIVCIFFVINVIATADMFTVVDKMISLGASEGTIGARWSIQAFTELPLFFAGAYLLKRFGDYRLMMFGTFMYVLRFIGYAVVQSPELIIVVALLQCVTYPLIMITSKTLVDDATPIHLRASGQTIAGAFYIGLSQLITPALAAMLATLFGLDIALMVIGLMGIIPLGLGLLYKRL